MRVWLNATSPTSPLKAWCAEKACVCSGARSAKFRAGEARAHRHLSVPTLQATLHFSEKLSDYVQELEGVTKSHGKRSP